MPTAMSRLTGGIGGRGPGETKLEINRRRADEREARLERNLNKLAKGRALRRSKRKSRNPTSGHCRLYQRRKVHPAQPE